MSKAPRPARARGPSEVYLAKPIQQHVLADLGTARERQDEIPAAIRAVVLNLVDRCELLLFDWLAVPNTKAGQWAVIPLVALAGAAACLRNTATRPHLCGDVETVAEAAWLLGKAEARVHDKRDREGGGRPPGSGDSNRELIRSVFSSMPEGSTLKALADEVTRRGNLRESISEQAVGQMLRKLGLRTKAN